MFSFEVESEASLKIGEFLYYGTSGQQNLRQAMSIYKMVDDMTSSGEIKGHALFKLGMIHQFGKEEEKIKVDHDIAQIYYDRALREDKTERVPVYIMSFYNRWQSLNVISTLNDFAREAIFEVVRTID